MISKIRIQGYRLYEDETIAFKPKLNIVVGGNESGKSTLVEAIGLAMTGRLAGKLAQEELNPFWFNQKAVREYFEKVKAGAAATAPEISIELFLQARDELQRLRGVNNSLQEDCPGVALTIRPSSEYVDEFKEYMKNPATVLPVEYYEVDWRSFADQRLTSRPRELRVALIDSRTVRSSSGVDYHTREILSEYLDPREKAQVSIAYRSLKDALSKEALAEVNTKIGALNSALQGRQVGLSMDHSSRTSWESAVVPHVQEIPFSMAGQGQQASIKIVLAMSRLGDTVSVVMVEEPENHLSHTSLNRLIDRIQELASDGQQLFVTTHSSFVLNRLGLDALVLLSQGRAAKFSDLDADTVGYFQKLPGYDTLRMVLAGKVVLVEGPSGEMIFDGLFTKKYGHRAIDEGVDVVSMRGISLARCLSLCKALGTKAAAVRDVDDSSDAEIRADLGDAMKELGLGPRSA
jgi:putative ATP-dependent endonuclease of OLD family